MISTIADDGLPMLEIAGAPVVRPLVFLPGWGFDGRVLNLAPAPAHCWTPAGLCDPFRLAGELAAWLDRRGIGECDLAGWSLGGLCAVDFARHYPARVVNLHLLGVRAAWPAAELAAIRQELAVRPEEFLRDFYRKCFLGYRSAYRRFRQELEPGCLARALAGPALLLRGLDFLARPATSFFESDRSPHSAVPRGRLQTHCWHGRRDLIAPVAERLRPYGADCRVLDHAGHALFLDLPLFGAGEAVLPVADPKPRIRQRFNRAAATYDAHADIQRQSLALLAAELPAELPPGPILELGCGTGNYTALLHRRFPESELLSLDFSEAMLGEARRKVMAANAATAGTASPPAPVHFLCQDGETFLAANQLRFAAVTANATLQWFADPAGALVRIREGLKPGGLLLATIFGRESLTELDQGLAEISDGRLRVAARAFPGREELQNMLTAAFAGSELHEHHLSRSFTSLAELLRHFRHTGTGGAGIVAAGAPASFSRRHFRELEAWFSGRPERFRLGFQVFVVKAVKEGGDNDRG